MHRPASIWPARRLRRFMSDRQGSTAIEFAVVAIPFFMFVFGVASAGLHFLTSSTLEKGVESAARKIRTGEAQKSAMTIEQFRASVCNEANFRSEESTTSGGWIDCSKLNVHIQQGAKPADIVPVACLTNGSLTPSTGTAPQAVADFSGKQSVFVLVTICYERETANLPFLSLANMPNGSELMQAASTFRTEPYED